MQYRNFGKIDKKVSALGFGAMRMPTIENEDGKKVIDQPEAIKMIRYAIDQGINYVDTAFPYHDGESELVVGKALKDGYRERTMVATKSPLWEIHSAEDFDRILDEQLIKLDMDYIDFYLMHACDRDRWKNVILKYGLLERAEAAKAAGKIRYLGFSFHDNAEAFMTILNGYDKWDFCQIQMNYIDVDNQATLKGMEEAAKQGLGVIIMEPLLGGKLAAPPIGVKNALDASKTPVEWALDFMWNRPEVSVTLSGMSNMEQLKENLLYADQSAIGMLNEKDIEMLAKAKEIYDTMALVSCTKCEYCMPCPFGLNIPGIFEAYNATVSKGMKKAVNLYQSLEILADDCKKCHKCEKVCPQAIPISEVMDAIKEVFREADAQ